MITELADRLVKGIRYDGGRKIVEACFLIIDRLGSERIVQLADVPENGVPVPRAPQYHIKEFNDDAIHVKVHADPNIVGFSTCFSVSVDYQTPDGEWNRVFSADGGSGMFAHIDYTCFRRGEWCEHLLQLAQTITRQNKVETWNDRFRPLKSRKKKTP